MLKWDGSYLDKYNNSIIQWEYKNGYFTYMKLILNEEEIYCKGCRNDDDFPCIVDELKTVFGLKKIGSHSLKIGKYNWIIYKLPFIIEDDNDKNWMNWIANFTQFNKFNKYTIEQEDEIRKWIIFRQLLGLKGVMYSSILLHTEDMIIETINEKKSEFHDKNKSIDYLIYTIQKKWFPEFEFKSYVRIFLGNEYINEFNKLKQKELVVVTIYNIRNQINEIINRINSKYLIYISFVVMKCNMYLT